MKKQNRIGTVMVMLVALGAIPRMALAGPPLICHAIDIGQAKSLPWSGNGWNVPSQNHYDLTRLVDDTLAILVPTTPALVRMETLRRATLYAQQDPMIAKQLFMRLRTRAIGADGKETRDALSLFDYGYLVETFKQARMIHGRQDSAGGNVSALALNADGYGIIERAIQLRGDDPQMEFAAALITLGGSDYPCHQVHLQRALDGSKNDPLLARNLATHFIGEKTETMAEMFRKRQARTD